MQIDKDLAKLLPHWIAKDGLRRTDIMDMLEVPESYARLLRGILKNRYDVQSFLTDTGYVTGNGYYDKENILVVGDLHAPFIKKGYLEFCINMREKYRCGTIVFIGDIIDNHYGSYHETDPDGDGGGVELLKAIEEVQKWHDVFPEAVVTVGNHDMIPNRKAFSSGTSKRWVKSIGEVLQTSGWKYVEEVVLNNILFTHGMGQMARNRMLGNMQSVVQGHYHSRSSIEYSVGIGHRFFAMQVGCGVDRKAYAFAYGRNFPKPHINVGVIAKGTPILEYMELGGKH